MFWSFLVIAHLRPRGNNGVVYADGACSGNGQPGASAGYGVYIPGINTKLGLGRIISILFDIKD